MFSSKAGGLKFFVNVERARTDTTIRLAPALVECPRDLLFQLKRLLELPYVRSRFTRYA